MSPLLQSIVKECDRLSAEEKLDLIQTLSQSLKTQMSSAPDTQSTAPVSNPEPSPRKASKFQPQTHIAVPNYTPKDAKDWINHIR